MQTIRIYRIIDERPGHFRVALILEEQGITGRVETEALRSMYPEGHGLYMWLR